MEKMVNFEGQDYIMRPVKIIRKIEYYSNFYKIKDNNGKIKIIGDYDMKKKRENYKKCKVKIVEKLNTGVEIRFADIEINDKYDRAKKKEKDRKEIEKGYFKWEDER